MKDRLFIAAEASWEIIGGKDGEVVKPLIVARITDQNGEPVSGLTKSNFKVHSMNVTQEADNLETVKNSSALTGTYLLVLHFPTQRAGQFVFAISVTKVTKATKDEVSQTLVGQTLVSVVKLK